MKKYLFILMLLLVLCTITSCSEPKFDTLATEEEVVELFGVIKEVASEKYSYKFELESNTVSDGSSTKTTGVVNISGVAKYELGESKAFDITINSKLTQIIRKDDVKNVEKRTIRCIDCVDDYDIFYYSKMSLKSKGYKQNTESKKMVNYISSINPYVFNYVKLNYDNLCNQLYYLYESNDYIETFKSKYTVFKENQVYKCVRSSNISKMEFIIYTDFESNLKISKIEAYYSGINETHKAVQTFAKAVGVNAPKDYESYLD